MVALIKVAANAVYKKIHTTQRDHMRKYQSLIQRTEKPNAL